MQPAPDGVDRVHGQPSNPLHQVSLIDGLHLRNIDDAGFREIAIALLQHYVTRSLGAAQVGSNQTHDSRGNSASVEDIALDDHTGMAFGGNRARGRAEIDPVNLALADIAHHWSPIVDRNLAFIFFVMRASDESGLE